MERRRALALAMSVSLVGAAAVVAASTGLLQAPDSVGRTGAAAGPAASDLDPVVVTERRDVYDTVVVPSTPSAPSTAGSGSGTGPGATATAPSDPSSPTSLPRSSPTPVSRGPARTTTTTSAPSGSSTTTTAPSTTPTTRPPGVPRDWPADKPIPPMPEGCQQPQLEDNGVWNCDH